jgi:hypothetical protein
VNYSILNNEILFTIGEKNKPKKRCISIKNIIVDIKLIHQICTSICKLGQGKSVYTQCQYTQNFAKPLINFFIHKEVSNPKSSSDWQSIILQFLNFYISDNIYSTASLSTKIEVWHTRISSFLNRLTDEGVIPLGLVIPKINLKKEVSGATHKKTLQDSLPEKTSTLDKLIIDTNFSKDDGVFLDEIEFRLRRKITILKRVCLEHFETLKTDTDLIQKHTENSKYSEINSLFDHLGKVVDPLPSKYNLICSHNDGESHIWTILIMKRLLVLSNDINCISAKSLSQLPFFNSVVFRHRVSVKQLESITTLTPCAFNLMTSAEIFQHFCGMLSGVDMAAICTLLTIEHPNFNPMSLQNAKLFGVKGKMHLITTDDAKTSIFSIDKPRVKKRKNAVLTPLSQELILFVIKLTQPIRNLLKRSSNPDWRYLFLGMPPVGGNLGKIKMSVSDALTCTKTRSLIRMYPQLEKAGLKRGVLNLQKVRNTMGVLKWFETGSIKEMSQCLGNSQRVALEHYMPPSLIEEWNTRIIRRFQNTLIILACRDEEFLLDVTDFSTMDELIHFTSKLLVEYKKGSSPIANLVHTFNIDTPNKEPINNSGIINVNLSVNGVAYLYAFHEYVLNNIPKNESTIHSSTMTDSAHALIKLSSFIKHACETSSISPSLREIIDYESLLIVHNKALKLKDILLKRFNHFHFSDVNWGTDAK